MDGQNKKYKVSILGDSISTYFGYTDFGYPVYYTEEKAKLYGLDSVDDTWWKQVIDSIGGELCVNNSYSGSLVTEDFESSACSELRCARLSNDKSPDIILIYIGTNDRGRFVDIGKYEIAGKGTFYSAYRIMLRQIRANYPQAKIVCGTLLLGYRKNSGETTKRGKLPYYVTEVNDAIKHAAEAEGCLVADLASFNEQYETLDYGHATKEGHKTMAELWLKSLKTLL